MKTNVLDYGSVTVNRFSDIVISPNFLSVPKFIYESALIFDNRKYVYSVNILLVSSYYLCKHVNTVDMKTNVLDYGSVTVNRFSDIVISPNFLSVPKFIYESALIFDNRKHVHFFVRSTNGFLDNSHLQWYFH